MAAALGAAKKDQITRQQQLALARLHSYGLAESLLQVRVTRDPDPCAGIGALHQAGAVVVGPQAATPEVAIGLVLGAAGEG